MGNIEPFPDWGSEYSRYKVLFVDALGRLAREGLVAQPADIDDLIQEFYATYWSGLAERYDANRGPAANYIFAAFVRFARRSIIQSQKWKSRLQDMGGLAGQVAEQAAPSQFDMLARGEERTLLREVLAEIRLDRRTVLLEYFKRGPRSRRELSRKYAISRYQIDELLINGFGELVMRLGARGVWLESDREVAVALWCEGWDVEHTAAHLGKSVHEVREARQRLKKVFDELLKSRSGVPPTLTKLISPGHALLDDEETRSRVLLPRKMN
ncbi:MAG TPA: hypothetical protein VG055_12130 [Planctomycetaceae bacterium]|jgi:DNA-directed RNA polymerase specialized sigma24 family protein|nr:hypothetical protein [Planctomycetaceae bacterium]